MNSEALVYYVDDEPAVRESLVYLLEAVGVRVVTFDSAEQFLDHYSPTCPGCLLLDVQLPGMDGLACQREIVARGWRIPVIIVSGYGDIGMAVTAMRAGAFDFLEKPFDEGEVIERVNRALAFDAKQRERNRERDLIAERMETLTARETQVLGLVVDGESTKSIATQLGTSFNTVQNQRASILRKMQARSVADLVRMVMISRSGDL